jgi:hypothetical protein
MVARQHESGYIALLAVLIIGAAAVAISLALLLTGTDSQRSTLVEQQSKQARGLMVACAEEALQQVHDNIAFSGNNSLALGQGSCTYSVLVNTPTVRIITVTATIGSIVKKVQVYVTIGSSSISITSWQEVS